MLDASFRVWLIEVNGSPAVAEKLLPGYVRGVTALVIDPLFPGARAAGGAGVADTGFDLVYKHAAPRPG